MRAGLTRRGLVGGTGLALLAGCSSPEPIYYTLRAQPGVVVPGGPRLVEVRRIGLAGYLDRSEIVRNSADYRLTLGGRDRWGEPLGDMVGRILTEDLTARLPGSSVFTSTGTISAEPGATVELDLQRLDADVSGQVVLLAQVSVSRGGTGRDRMGARTVRLTVQPDGPETRALVAAMSLLVAQLADQVAGMLRELGPG